MRSLDASWDLAQHLQRLRLERGLTLVDLATTSGVSRASLSRIENGEVSPTAETLGRLAAAFALPISRLLAAMDKEAPSLVRVAEQSVWRDQGNGFSRRAVSPPSGELRIEVIRCDLEPRSRIAYDRPAIPRQEHHLILLSGHLRLTIDGESHELREGDCLRYRLVGPSCFETDDRAASYLIALA